MSYDLTPIDFKIPNSEVIIQISMLPQKHKDYAGKWIDDPPKPYMNIAQRLVWFNLEKQDWIIDTVIEFEWEQGPSRFVRFKCSLINPEGITVRVGRKTKQILNPKDYESAETGSIGRALALLGYGTQYAHQDIGEEEGEVVDAPTELSKGNNHGARESKREDKSIHHVTETDKTHERPRPENFGKDSDLNNKLSDIVRGFGSKKALSGTYTGKSFEEIFNSDETQGFKWTKARHDQINEGANLDLWAIDYLTYAKEMGFDG